MKKKSANNGVLYYACFHPDGTEKIVYGFAEARLLEAPWKRRGFSSVAEARDFLDNRKRTELARVSAELTDKVRALQHRIEEMDGNHAITVKKLNKRIHDLTEALMKCDNDNLSRDERMRIAIEESGESTEKRRRHYSGKKHHIIVNDIFFFESSYEAAEKLGVSKSTVLSRINPKSEKFCQDIDGWRIRPATEEEIKEGRAL